MIQIRKILLPTDFSDPSRQAVRQAVDLAEHHQAELILLHVTEETSLPARQVIKHGSFPNLADEIRKGAERSLAEISEELVKGRVATTLVVRSGPPALEIAAAAQELGVDLIVIASHGYGLFRRFLLGSTTERVMRTAPCSVLLVRGDEAATATGEA